MHQFLFSVVQGLQINAGNISIAYSISSSVTGHFDVQDWQKTSTAL